MRILKYLPLLFLLALPAKAQISGVGNFGCSGTVVTGTAATSATANNTVLGSVNNTPAYGVLVQLDQTSTITGGAITFQVSFDGGINYSAIPVAQVLNPGTGANSVNPYTLVASTNQAFLIVLAGASNFQIKLTTVISGTGTVTPYMTLLCTPPTIGPLVLDTSGNLRIDLYANTFGTLSTNTAQFGGNPVVTGTGASGSGIPRVTLSNDSSLAANQSVNVNQVAGASTGATNPLYTALADGINGPVAVKPASTSAVAADKSLVVQLSPNTPNLATPLNVTCTNALNCPVQVTDGTNPVGPMTFFGNTPSGYSFPVNAFVTNYNQFVNSFFNPGLGRALPTAPRLTGSLGQPITATGNALNVYPQGEGGCAGFPPSITSSFPVNIASATTKVIIPGTALQTYICAANLLAGAGDNAALVYGVAGSTCGSGVVGMAGGTTAGSGWNFAANSGIAYGNGLGILWRVPPGNEVCLITSSSAQLSGSLTAVQAP